MTVRYKDYYQILDVPRNASADDIKKAYRKLARKYHPDVSKEAGAEQRFKEITEAYEVLGDPEKRKRYDSLGADWQAGQDFRPPPGWQNIRFDMGGGPQSGGFSSFSGLGDDETSDFFQSLFGDLFGGAFGAAPGAAGRGGRSRRAAARGQDQEASITVRLEDAYHGATRTVRLATTEPDANGMPRQTVKRYTVRIPPGTTDGSRIRLGGQGSSGRGGGSAGDLYLRVKLAPHPIFRVNGLDLEADLSVAPWEAVLGGKVTVPTLDGPASLQIPPGTQGGQRVKLRGKGLPHRREKRRGNLFAVVRIAIPKTVSDAERKLYQQLAEVSDFNPRE
mgnify:CR=1 FL=1